MSSRAPLTEKSAVGPTQSRKQTLESLLSQGEQALAANNRPAALACFARATKVNPNSAVAWARRAATTADRDDAIMSWAYALALAPGNIDAQTALAQEIQTKLSSSQSPDVPSLLALGKVLAKVGLKRHAARVFERATELDQANEEAWVWRAGLTENPEEMIPLLNLVLTLNPRNTKAQAGLRWAMSQLGRYEPSPKSEPAPVAMAPADEAAKLVEEGHKLLDAGDKEKAHVLFKHATELDARNEDAWLWRGSTTADIEEALVCMEKALAINPNNQSAREARSWLRVKRLRESARNQTQTSVPDLSPAQLAASTGAPGPWRSNRVILLAAIIVVLLVFVVLFTFRLLY